jgi:hypothetical protein
MERILTLEGEGSGGKLINILFNCHDYPPLFFLIPTLSLIFSFYFTQSLIGCVTCVIRLCFVSFSFKL